MTDHWDTIEDALGAWMDWKNMDYSKSYVNRIQLRDFAEQYNAALAFVREQRTPPTVPLYSHRNGESVAPDLAGWYWVRVERLEDFSTKVRLEVWRRGFGRWLEFGNVNELGAVGEILSIYGPIPQPWDTPATLSADTQGKE